MKQAIHKDTRKLSPSLHLCGDKTYSDDRNYQPLCCSQKWSKVTCKRCLKLRKKK